MQSVGASPQLCERRQIWQVGKQAGPDLRVPDSTVCVTDTSMTDCHETLSIWGAQDFQMGASPAIL